MGRLGFSLLLSVALGACASVALVASANIALERSTREGRFHVALLAPTEGVLVHRLHAWQVRVTTHGGAPLRGGRVYLTADMPEHGHGLPTRPVSAGETAPGVYRIDGVKFHMAGHWVLTVAVNAGGQEDTALFDLKLDWPKVN